MFWNKKPKPIECVNNPNQIKDHHWHVIDTRKKKMRDYPICVEQPETMYSRRGGFFYYVLCIHKYECCFCKKETIGKPEESRVIDMEALNRILDIDEHPFEEM